MIIVEDLVSINLTNEFIKIVPRWMDTPFEELQKMMNNDGYDDVDIINPIKTNSIIIYLHGGG